MNQAPGTQSLGEALELGPRVETTLPPVKVVKQNRAQLRRAAKQGRKMARAQARKPQAQLHLFLTQPEVRMLNRITEVLNTDPREFLRRIIPIHYKEIEAMVAKAQADQQAPVTAEEFAAAAATVEETAAGEDAPPLIYPTLEVADESAT